MKNKKTYLFIQCLIDALYPEVAVDLTNTLERLGIDFFYPKSQTCCGQPLFNTGHRREAIQAAKKFITLFEPADFIVCPSGSCVHMVKYHYLDLFIDNHKWYQRAKNVSNKIYEYTEFLVDILNITDVQATYPEKVTYHDSCHLLRGLGIQEQPRLLLKNVKGLQLIEMSDSEKCCGFGGAFAFQHPKISSSMLEDKVNNIIASGAEAVVGCDVSCLMNIEGMIKKRALPIDVLHIAQVLAK